MSQGPPIVAGAAVEYLLVGSADGSKPGLASL